MISCDQFTHILQDQINRSPFYQHGLTLILTWISNCILYSVGCNCHQRRDGHHFLEDILKCIFANENIQVLIKSSLKFVPKGPIDNIPALVKIMAWYRSGDKPLSEPCAVCHTGVGRSSIRFSECNLWVHYKKCSGLKTLSKDLSYECPRCRGVPGVRPVDGRPFKEVEVGDCVLEAVDRFCYLGDMLSAGGGCIVAATARCKCTCAWGKFRENLPLLTSKPVPLDLRGRLFSSNVCSSMLHGTETWPMTSAALHRLCRNDRAMIRWICGVKPSDDPSMDELHAKLGICDLAILVRERRLRWFGHVMRSNGEINRVRSRSVPGRKGPGRPKETREECVKQYFKVCGLCEAGTQDRLSWRSSVKNSRQEPTPSNGSLPQSMAAPPARRILGMRTRSFNKTGFDWLIDW